VTESAPAPSRPRPSDRSGEDREPGYPKASLLLRAGARATDLLIAWAAYRAGGPAGVVMAFLYLLFADGMLTGQSPGKRLFGVRVMYLPTRAPARHRDSVLRNGPLGLVIILRMMPSWGDWAFWIGLAVIGGVEVYRCLRSPDGVRLGDLWAQTQVVDGKVVSAERQPVGAERQPVRAPVRLKQHPGHCRRGGAALVQRARLAPSKHAERTPCASR
jgi:uncharacterized RDD family membrane protein YckC